MNQKIHGFWGGAGLVSFSTVSGLILLEFLVIPQTVTRGIDRDLALMGFYAYPGILIDDTPINSKGFTGHELLETEKSSDIVRILTLGGSTMFNRRMTERMIDSWHDVFPSPPEVVGGALRTHTTRASVIKYEYHFSKYRFDYVLIYHGINDLWANNVDPGRYSSDYAHQNPWGRRTAFLDNVVLARIIYNAFHPGAGAFPESASNRANFMAEESFEANLRSLVLSVRENDGKPVLMTFAWYIPEDYTLDRFLAGGVGYNNPTRYDYCPVELWGDVAYVNAGLERTNAIVRRIASELNVDLVEQYDHLGQNLENFGDPVHFSEIGTERFIGELTEYFRREVRVSSM